MMASEKGHPFMLTSASALYKDVVQDIKKLRSGCEVQMVYLQHKLHVIDYNNKIHFIWHKKPKQSQLQIIPRQLYSVCMVSTRFGQYLILFGGYTGSMKNPHFSKDIFVVDMIENRIIKSKVKCPGNKLYHASIVDDKENDDLLTTNFIKCCYNNNNNNKLIKTDNYFNNMPLLPMYLEQFLTECVSNQEVFLIEKGTGQRWKIDVDSVLESL
eukprot:259543_1